MFAALCGAFCAAAGAASGGVMITIHGGAWITTGRAAMAGEAPAAKRYAAEGWLVHNIDHRPGRYAVCDTLAAYDRIRRAHPHSPICASGDSAGGHLALMLALRRPSLTCAISNAGPTDLVHFPAGYVHDVIQQYLAPYMDLRRWSPALNRRKIRQPLLLAYAPYDTVVPYAQGLAMRHAAPHAELVALPPGMSPWIHTGVDAGALARERRIERAFLARCAGRARSSAAASGRPAR